MATNRAVLISPRHGALFENNQFSTECRRISPIACIAPNKCTAKIRRHSVYDIFGSARPRSWGVGRGRGDGWSELGVLEHLPVTHFEKCALLIIKNNKVAMGGILGSCKTTCTEDTSTVAAIVSLRLSTPVFVLEARPGSWIGHFTACKCQRSQLLPKPRGHLRARRGPWSRMPSELQWGAVRCGGGSQLRGCTSHCNSHEVFVCAFREF